MSFMGLSKGFLSFLAARREGDGCSQCSFVNPSIFGVSVHGPASVSGNDHHDQRNVYATHMQERVRRSRAFSSGRSASSDAG